jgi:amino acid transporter
MTFYYISVVVTGIAVLLGLTNVRDPLRNFVDPFQGSNWNVNALATALVKSNFAYIGYANAFQVTGEVRGKSPARTVRTAGAITIASCAVLFTLANVAYVAAVPKETFSHSGELIAALFFKNVFGDHVAAKLLPALVSLSCFGNIVRGIFSLITRCQLTSSQKVAVVSFQLNQLRFKRCLAIDNFSPIVDLWKSPIDSRDCASRTASMCFFLCFI